MTDFFAPLPGYSPFKLAALTVLGFALTAAASVPTFNRDAGIPDVSELREAHGCVANISPQKYGIAFRLHGRAETFDYPSKANGYGIVKSALTTAGNKEVTLLFHPNPHTPPLGSAYYDVWQVAVDGKTVRTFEEVKGGFRSDNKVGAWLFAGFLLMSLYMSVLTWRARTQKS